MGLLQTTTTFVLLNALIEGWEKGKPVIFDIAVTCTSSPLCPALDEASLSLVAGAAVQVQANDIIGLGIAVETYSSMAIAIY